MSLRSLSCLAVVALPALLGSCKDTSVDKGDIVITGAVSGSTVPEGLTSGVLWRISPDGPDYGYGSGDSGGGRFEVRLTGGPPAEGLNNNSVGVGLVVLALAGQDVPRGIVSDESPPLLAGVSTRTAIIYRSGDDIAGMTWVSRFPAGLSCGRCVAATGDDKFDTFEPVACSAIEVDAGASLESSELCRWF